MLELLLWPIVTVVAFVAGVFLSQRAKDWFSGVESDIRAKANEASATVLTAAKTEAAKAKARLHEAVDNVVAGAKAALPTPPFVPVPAASVAPVVVVDVPAPVVEVPAPAPAAV